jgi:tetratricopeptide (TPR) repeat protein
MQLIERTSYLEILAESYRRAESGNGNTLFLAGEAGIGKTSLVNHFTNELESKASVYTGACDSLFSPRPLGPLFDIAADLKDDLFNILRTEKNRAIIFSAFLQKFASSPLPAVLIIEDIHWADEATIDFIKYLGRRISKLRCLFLLTYRDDEIHIRHPVKTLFGELPSGSFSKLHINVLSRDAVNGMARDKGYASGEKIYSLTGGNPFYVTEVLTCGHGEIPERVKDSILAVFHSKSETVQERCELLALLPSRIDYVFLDHIEGYSAEELEEGIRSGVLIRRNDHVAFKHELLRLAIEQCLSSYRKKSLHQQILNILTKCPADTVSLSQLVHHAKSAEDKELIARFAPEAAREAANVGAHLEASKLYLVAIKNTSLHDPALASLHEHHAYECYLTNQMSTAVESQEFAVSFWRKNNVSLRLGDALRFLSRISWFDGRRDKAMTLAVEAIDALENGFPTRERALAYSNLSQLNMLGDFTDQALHWGGKAIELADKLNDVEIRAHALNNMGSSLLKIYGCEAAGEEKLKESLALALQHGFHEHAARAYTNLASFCGLIKQHEKAHKFFDEGVKYSEELDLLSWSYYMLSEKTNSYSKQGCGIRPLHWQPRYRIIQFQ